jgi:hypothetical protein
MPVSGLFGDTPLCDCAYLPETQVESLGSACVDTRVANIDKGSTVCSEGGIVDEGGNVLERSNPCGLGNCVHKGWMARRLVVKT